MAITTQWLGIYHHRHGQDYALFDHEPADDEMAAFWDGDFEPNREDEYFETYGPLKLVDVLPTNRVDVDG